MEQLSLTKRDYLLMSVIGVSVVLFSIPVLIATAINLPFGLSFINVVYLSLFFLTFANLGLWIASIIARKIPVIMQIVKFGAVGVFNTFLDWSVFNLLIIMTGLSVGYGPPIFSGLGFIVANIGSFFWNKNWTFTSRKGTLIQFFLVSLIGFGVKVGAVYLIVNIIGPQGGISENLWANVGNMAGTVFFMVWNFIGYKFWVFKK